jgi:hypothetical protein
LLHDPRSIYAKEFQAACEEAAAYAVLLSEEQRLNYLAALKERAREDAQFTEDMRHHDEKIKKFALQLAQNAVKKPAESSYVQDDTSSNLIEIINRLVNFVIQLNAIHVNIANLHTQVQLQAQQQTTAIMAAHHLASQQAAQAYRDQVVALTITLPGDALPLSLTPVDLEQLALEAPVNVHASPFEVRNLVPEVYEERMAQNVQHYVEDGMAPDQAEVKASEAVVAMEKEELNLRLSIDLIPIARAFHFRKQQQVSDYKLGWVRMLNALVTVTEHSRQQQILATIQSGEALQARLQAVNSFVKNAYQHAYEEELKCRQMIDDTLTLLEAHLAVAPQPKHFVGHNTVFFAAAARHYGSCAQEVRPVPEEERSKFGFGSGSKSS